MTLLRMLDELSLVGVFDRGQGNKERVVYRTQRRLNLGEYLVALGASQPDGTVTPLQDSMLWLGDELIDSGCLVFVYSGPGKRRVTEANGEPSVVIHWGRKTTVFQNSTIVPVVLHVSGMLAPSPSLTPRADEAIASALWGNQNRLPGNPPPPPPGSLPPYGLAKSRSTDHDITADWLQHSLLLLGFDKEEVDQSLDQCIVNLRRRGFESREEVQRFFEDERTKHDLSEIYRDELHRPLGALDPSGFTWWGPLLHRVPTHKRAEGIATLREHFRRIYESGAR